MRNRIPRHDSAPRESEPTTYICGIDANQTAVCPALLRFGGDDRSGSGSGSSSRCPGLFLDRRVLSQALFEPIVQEPIFGLDPWVLLAVFSPRLWSGVRVVTSTRSLRRFQARA